MRHVRGGSAVPTRTPRRACASPCRGKVRLDNRQRARPQRVLHDGATSLPTSVAAARGDDLCRKAHAPERQTSSLPGFGRAHVRGERRGARGLSLASGLCLAEGNGQLTSGASVGSRCCAGGPLLAAFAKHVGDLSPSHRGNRSRRVSATFGEAPPTPLGWSGERYRKPSTIRIKNENRSRSNSSINTRTGGRVVVDARRADGDANRGCLPECAGLNGARRQDAETAIAAAPDASEGVRLVTTLAQSGWHIGDNDLGWMATFDYLIKPSTLNKVPRRAVRATRSGRHANISTTSRYLKTTRTGLQQYLKQFEAARRIRTSFAQTDADDARILPAAPAADTAYLLNRKVVRKRGLEPPLPCGNKLLRLARLPVPPLPHVRGTARQELRV